MSFEFNSSEPIYIQIINHIKKKILTMEFKGGDKLPSVREYATELKVNPNTIQRVYSELEDIKLIYTQRGIGKFVTEDEEVVARLRIEMSKAVILKFIKDTKEMGFNKEELVNLLVENYEEA